MKAALQRHRQKLINVLEPFSIGYGGATTWVKTPASPLAREMHPTTIESHASPSDGLGVKNEAPNQLAQTLASMLLKQK